MAGNRSVKRSEDSSSRSSTCSQLENLKLHFVKKKKKKKEEDWRGGAVGVHREIVEHMSPYFYAKLCNNTHELSC